jgi:tetratricopeptide (TPR) repeat protein
MRNPSPIVALVAALLTIGPGGSAQAQQQSQPVPDAPAPQPQKKPAPKAQPPDSAPPPADEPAPKPAPAKNDNAFPEDVSRDAAKKADDSKPPTAKDNPFPEDVSREAAKAAGNDATPAPAGRTDLPPGVSSSESTSSSADGDEITNPGQAKKDADVGGFYLKQGNYQGALLRYKDATAADPANVEAIFGLAETERMLKKNAEAARDYQLYLDIVPNGPRSKQALKALKTLPPG